MNWPTEAECTSPGDALAGSTSPAAGPVPSRYDAKLVQQLGVAVLFATVLAFTAGLTAGFATLLAFWFVFYEN